MTCAPSEDSDQPGHLPSLIRVIDFRFKKPWVLGYPLSIQRRLIKLGWCPCWSESSLGTQVILLLFFSCCNSYQFCMKLLFHFNYSIIRDKWKINIIPYLCGLCILYRILNIRNKQVWANSVDPQGAVWSGTTLFVILVAPRTLNRSSSHRCGFHPSSGHMRQVKFCLQVVRWFFSGISHFRPTEGLTQLKLSEIILTGRKTQIKKIKYLSFCLYLLGL